MTENKIGHILVDFDRTLVHHTTYSRPETVGKPIVLMLDRVKQWLKDGKEVRIFTARVAEDNPDADENREVIAKWCLKHLGQKLLIQNYKDCASLEIWDDRAIQVIPNTGKRADGEN